MKAAAAATTSALARPWGIDAAGSRGAFTPRSNATVSMRMRMVSQAHSTHAAAQTRTNRKRPESGASSIPARRSREGRKPGSCPSWISSQGAPATIPAMARMAAMLRRVRVIVRFLRGRISRSRFRSP